MIFRLESIFAVLTKGHGTKIASSVNKSGNFENKELLHSKRFQFLFGNYGRN